MESPAVTSEATETAATRSRRSVLAGLALVLACLAIVVTSMAIWVHQVALDTDRFTEIVRPIVTDPAVTDPIAARVSEQVVTALDVQSRVAALLPGASSALAAPITAAAQEAVERRLQGVLTNPEVQAGLVRTLSVTHERLVAFLRGDTTALTVADGYLYLDVWPIIGAALTHLQSMGLIPANVQLPDLSSGGPPAALAEQLQTRLGITLPPDFGTIRLTEAQRLATAQTIVQAFDALVVILIGLSVLLVVLTIWLARNRRRMIVYLALGVVIALVVARFALRGLSSLVAGQVADADLGGAITTVVATTVADFVGWTTILLVVTAALGIVAYVAGRPAWLRRLVSRSDGDAVAEGGQVADRGTLERVGIGAVLFAVVWIAIGIEVALLGALLVGAWLLIVRIVAGPPTADGPTAAT